MSGSINAQNTFSLNGLSTGFKGYENNPAGFSLIRDWAMNITYGTEFSSEINSNLYSLSLYKKIDRHLFSVRYTPGYQKEFLFRTGQSIVFGDSSTQTLESRFLYKENFGFSYSFSFSENFTAGFTFRYFTEDFNREIVKPVFSDSIYIIRDNISTNSDLWRGDIGLHFRLSDNLDALLSSINLLHVGRFINSDDDEKFELKRKRGVMIGLRYNPVKPIDIHTLYESSGSFQLGQILRFQINENRFAFGLTAAHDNEQSPFISSVIPSLVYSGSFFTLTLSAVKYFSDRIVSRSFEDFSSSGIPNIINNRYSFDKISLSADITLNTIRERLVKFIDAEILTPIYPAFSDYYQMHPYARAKVLNISSRSVSVRTASRIEGINTDIIQSQLVLIAPGDTADVYFFTILPEQYLNNKANISYADFYVYSVHDEPDDVFQKAVLIQSINGWDGSVVNLKHFIKRDPGFAMNYSKNILSRHKSILDTTDSFLLHFRKAKIIFNEMVKELVYISDPRASAEFVQFPSETVKLKGGDCDDLSVLYSALLESVGIETALVDYRSEDRLRHVNVLVNTGLTPANANVITGNDKKFFVRKSESGDDEVWITIETTSLSDFETAWNIGSEKFYDEAIASLGIAKGIIQIVDVD